MSLIFLDSLSRYGAADGVSAASNLGRYGWYAGGNVHNRTGSLFGSNYLQIQGGGSGKDSYSGYLYRPWSGATLGMSFKFSSAMMFSAVGWQPFLQIDFSSGNPLYFMFDTQRTGGSYSAGQIQSTYIQQFASQTPWGNWHTILGFPTTTTSTYNFPTAPIDQTWRAVFSTINWIHIDFLINASTGSVTCRTVLPAATVTNHAFNNITGSRTITGIYLGSLNNTCSMLYSDLMLWSADSVGLSAFPNNPRLLRVQRLAPTANGALNSWTPSSGNNFATVNERPYSDVQFTTGVGSGTKQTFAMGGLGSATESIKGGILGIQLNPNIQDAGDEVSQVSPIQVISSVETAMSSGIVPSRVSYSHSPRIITTNPATSQPYTASQINNAEIGFNVQ